MNYTITSLGTKAAVRARAFGGFPYLATRLVASLHHITLPLRVLERHS
jgi:hypothetical protein